MFLIIVYLQNIKFLFQSLDISLSKEGTTGSFTSDFYFGSKVQELGNSYLPINGFFNFITRFSKDEGAIHLTHR